MFEFKHKSTAPDGSCSSTKVQMSEGVVALAIVGVAYVMGALAGKVVRRLHETSGARRKKSTSITPDEDHNHWPSEGLDGAEAHEGTLH